MFEISSKDFTIFKYKFLLDSLKSKDYSFYTVCDYISKPLDKCILLRHDVDLLPYNSLSFAKIQSDLGIKGTYYFRSIPESWDEKVIKEINSLDHEVGYHYETMDTANGDIDKAWDLFRFNLDRLRSLVGVKTICMHGSPKSKFDNRELWNKYDYRTLGIIGEPYYDINFDNTFYLTDTGRRWDGWKYSLRDKVPQQQDWIKKGLVFRSTDDLIVAIKNNVLPRNTMFTMHPQRWTNMKGLWLKELFFQNIKNIIKKFLL